MQVVQTITVGAGGAASIEFTGIPQSGRDLMILLSVRASGSGAVEANFFRFNGDTSNVYDMRALQGDGSSTSAFNALSQSAASSLTSSNAGATANTFSNSSVYIPNYTSSNFKAVSVDTVSENNETLGLLRISSALWRFGGAVTSFRVTPNGGTFVQNSMASLYIIS